MAINKERQLQPAREFSEENAIPLSTLYFWSHTMKMPGIYKLGKRLMVDPEMLLSACRKWKVAEQ